MNKPIQFEVEPFKYNGFSVQSFGGKTDYTAEFKSWTNDPGIALCKCSDGVDRLIPSCQLIGDTSSLPEEPQRKANGFGGKGDIFGLPSIS